MVVAVFGGKVHNLLRTRTGKALGLLAAMALAAVACGGDGAAETTITTAAAPRDTEATTTTEASVMGTEVINLAVLSDCEGVFGGFHE